MYDKHTSLYHMVKSKVLSDLLNNFLGGRFKFSSCGIKTSDFFFFFKQLKEPKDLLLVSEVKVRVAG